MRIFIEEATGFRTRGGHPYIEVTDIPCPCIMEGRPVSIVVIYNDRGPCLDAGCGLRSTRPRGTCGWCRSFVESS